MDKKATQDTMNSFYNNGYQETIQKGLSAVRSFRSGISTGAAAGMSRSND